MSESTGGDTRRQVPWCLRLPNGELQPARYLGHLLHRLVPADQLDEAICVVPPRPDRGPGALPIVVGRTADRRKVGTLLLPVERRRCLSSDRQAALRWLDGAPAATWEPRPETAGFSAPGGES